MASVLLVHGSHCRLENICPDTQNWLQDEQFYQGGQLVTRKAGEKADPRLMPAWRKLRASEPELFKSLRVWQQPAATMDSVIWRWQCELDAQSTRQAIRVTDCCTSCWTDQAKEAGYLLQQMNCPVAASCTPLQQPTDTHLAKPAKDAGRAEKERLRELMRLACLRLGQPVRYQSTNKEVLQVAQAMHDRMVSLNLKTEAVLQACRAGGWFAYRPDHKGRLQPAEHQAWAQLHPQAAGRVAASQLTDRMNWLDDNGKPRQAQEDWQAQQEEAAQTEPLKQPVFKPDEDLDLGTEPEELLGLADYEQAAFALTHPSRRTENSLLSQIEGLGMYRAEINKVQARLNAVSKGKAKAKTPDKRKGSSDRKLRSELAVQFQQDLQQAGGNAAKRLKQMLPVGTAQKNKPEGQTKKSKKQKKKNEKKQAKLKAGWLKKTKAWLKRKQAKKVEKQKARLAGKAGGELFLGEEGGPLTGTQVRLVDFDLVELLRNSPGKVNTHFSTGTVVVTVPSGTVRTFPVDRVYPLTGKEKLGLPEDTPDLKTATKEVKQRAMAACGGQVKVQIKPDTLLETPELGSAWEELGFRAVKAGDQWPHPQAVFLNPTLSGFWLTNWGHSPGSPESQEALVLAREQVQGLVNQPRQAGFCAFPICAGGHYTLLLLVRQATPDDQTEPNKLAVVYKDSLVGDKGRGHQACRKAAQTALSFLVACFGPGLLSQEALPPLSASGKQKDSNSCGFFCLAWLEEEYRQLRGEGVFRLSYNFRKKAASLTRWNRVIQAECEKVKAATEAREAAKKQAASSSGPPPVVDLTTGCPAQPSVQPSSEALVVAPTAPLSQSEVFGCSRCRYAKSGCVSCNPAKMAAFAHKHSKA